ncbi:hypothetical protein XENOCAPTIV_028969 [Xenoophorus captivus]|uniref:Uncharacterized protein n=1 Tax=Xenoophorus captivus TaxID=1517983 RepID=A0ABV0RAY2_9TELE
MSFLLVLKANSFIFPKENKVQTQLKKNKQKNKNPAASPEWLLHFKLPCYHSGTGGRSLEAPLEICLETGTVTCWRLSSIVQLNNGGNEHIQICNNTIMIDITQ